MRKSLIFILMTICLTGCGYTNQQSQDIANTAQAVTAAITDLQATVIPLVENLNEQGAVSDADAEKVVKIAGEVDRVKQQVSDIAVAMQGSTGDGVEGVINTLSAVNTATAPYNPFSTYISIGLGLAGAIAGLFAKRKNTQAVSATKALAETVKGIQAVKNALGTDERAIRTIKTSLGEAQSTDTKQAVAVIKAAL